MLLASLLILVVQTSSCLCDLVAEVSILSEAAVFFYFDVQCCGSCGDVQQLTTSTVGQNLHHYETQEGD